MENEINIWYRNTAWACGWNCKPHESINKDELYIQHQAFPERWLQAFTFLAKSDLQKLEPGVYPILGNEVYAMVSEYETKLQDEARYESHKRFADIQYLISGSEGMGLAQAERGVVSETYSEKQDVMFYYPMEGVIHKADPSNFFIFFPGDAHQPCIATGKKAMVRKIVIKVGLNENMN